MKICHISDWHGGRSLLPKADLYVVTGDMLPNFPFIYFKVDAKRVRTPSHHLRDGLTTEKWQANMHLLGMDARPRPEGEYAGRYVDKNLERTLQERWIGDRVSEGGYRVLLENADAPVVCVRGNHDFTDLAPLFGGDVWEVSGDDPSRTVDLVGLRIGGMRGINRIVLEWSDEIGEEEMASAAGLLSDDLDLLLTHAPPLGTLDYHGAHWGSQSISSYVQRRMYTDRPLRAHCFGHVHEGRGMLELGGAAFSNAATAHNVFEISP